MNEREMQAEVQRVFDQMGVTIDPCVKVSRLSVGERQQVEIARTIQQQSQIIIMDEPTAALGVKESRKVLDLVLKLKEQGCSVIVISHNMRHVFNVADRIVVLRGGVKVGERLKSKTTPDEIVKLIVGAEML